MKILENYHKIFGQVARSLNKNGFDSLFSQNRSVEKTHKERFIYENSTIVLQLNTHNIFDIHIIGSKSKGISTGLNKQQVRTKQNRDNNFNCYVSFYFTTFRQMEQKTSFQGNKNASVLLFVRKATIFRSIYNKYYHQVRVPHDLIDNLYLDDFVLASKHCTKHIRSIIYIYSSPVYSLCPMKTTEYCKYFRK